jgi:dihydropteroate synthase
MTFSPRPHFEGALRTRTLSLGMRTLVMGVLNLTPDSFSDGGSYPTPAAALDRSLEMLDQGVDIVDVGGESTRPGSIPLAPAEEQSRVLPVIAAILKNRREAILSIDTYHAETARAAIEAGAEIVNDGSGHLWDARMAETCAELGCGTVLMHTRGRPGEWKAQPALASEEVMPIVLSELNQQIGRALAMGVAQKRMAVDPGFGFGKIRGENYPLLASLEMLQQLGFPVIAGLSRKSFLRLSGDALDPSELKRALLSATLAANTAAILAGAHIVRVHDVAEAKAAAAVADAVLSAAGSSAKAGPRWSDARRQ